MKAQKPEEDSGILQEKCFSGGKPTENSRRRYSMGSKSSFSVSMSYVIWIN